MVKKTIADDTLELTKGILIGGAGLTFGSSLIGKLPSTSATSNIQAGFTTASSFIPPIATIGAAGITLKQLKKLEKQFK